jgi:hypothetical protein
MLLKRTLLFSLLLFKGEKFFQSKFKEEHEKVSAVLRIRIRDPVPYKIKIRIRDVHISESLDIAFFKHTGTYFFDADPG